MLPFIKNRDRLLDRQVSLTTPFCLITTHSTRLKKNRLPDLLPNLYDYPNTYSKEVCDEIISRIES